MPGVGDGHEDQLRGRDAGLVGRALDVGGGAEELSGAAGSFAPALLGAGSDDDLVSRAGQPESQTEPLVARPPDDADAHRRLVLRSGGLSHYRIPRAWNARWHTRAARPPTSRWAVSTVACAAAAKLVSG